MFDIVAAAIVIIACIVIALTTLAVWRAPDPLTRANVLSTNTSLALPLLIIAKLIHDIGAGTFLISDLIVAALAITGLLVVLAIGSFVMGRSLYEVAREDAERE
ncbi:Na+/H+ antiporter subunit G [Corynebacterium pseudopelargi]|uniref:Putative monovalent cation/H+ antiporter subunit G n=1 Tax=Corynebacterium pseudopelargi TaxID=2080757 RepID=A0A3G6IX07_9CORY|nr:Na+/H+ antiporter subunit G [Corynebacterium pseudopelargi]AZA10197.1 putative monovalent cation/H+ antiporter subunit G [Corynebacterium pseudopelargi]